METPVDRTSKENWAEVIPHRDDVLLEGFEIFKDYLVVEERKTGLTQIRVIAWTGQGRALPRFRRGDLQRPRSPQPRIRHEWLRYDYSSLTTPDSRYDYNMVDAGEKALEAGGGPGRLRPRQLPGRAAVSPRRRTASRCRFRWSTERDSGRTASPLLALWLRLLRREHGRRLSARPGSACSTAASSMPSPTSAAAQEMGRALVRRRQAAEEEEHLHRFHRLRRIPGRREIRRPGKALRHGRQRRRPADGRRGQYAAGPVPGRRRRRALRGRRHDHARHDASR